MTEAPYRPPLVMTPKLQGLARGLIHQIQTVLRTMRIHDPTNRALLIATEKLKDTINTLWAAQGGAVRLQFIEGVVYLNDMRVRTDAATKVHVDDLEKEFERRQLGGLAFARPVDTATLQDFLLALSRPVENEEDLAHLRQSLLEMKDLAIELLGPKEFADGEREDRELRIDKRTFALQTYAKSIIAVREFVRALEQGQDPLAGRLHLVRIVQDLVDIATERVNFLLKLTAIKTAHDYAYNHSANTCVIALVIGKALRIERLDLVDLGTSALLADVGWAMLPDELLNRSEELSDLERRSLNDAMIRQIRTLIGKNALNDATMRRVVVAFEHHHPYRDPTTGETGATHLFSRIVAVADAFDALTTKRPWREGYAADEALRMLVEGAGTKYDPLIVKLLVNMMGMHPLGSAVRLSNGEIAIVYHNSNDPRAFDRPWVKLVRDAEGNRVRRTILRNLADQAEREITIVGTASATDLEGIDAARAVVV